MNDTEDRVRKAIEQYGPVPFSRLNMILEDVDEDELANILDDLVESGALGFSGNGYTI